MSCSREDAQIIADEPIDDVLELIDDDGRPVSAAAGLAAQAAVWRVLVVDDDREVHAATAYALAGVEMLGRPLALHFAGSAAAARALLRARGDDFAVILLDVVMEADDSGLQLVRTIREDFGLSMPRIILRTGQPGYAPEFTVIRDYDINDYRTKSELTQTRLMSSLLAALRSYIHLQSLETNRRGLEKMGQRLQAWNAKGQHAAVIKKLAQQLDGVCARLPAQDETRAACGGVFKAHPATKA